MSVRVFIAFLCLSLCLCCAGMGQAAEEKEPGGKAMQGQPWAFGASESRKDALWQRSVNAHDMHDKAMPDSKPHMHGVDTRKGIDSALQGRQKHGKKDELGVSWEREKSGWRNDANARRTPDEYVPVESRHHVRAYADVDASEDLNISVGPELIVKDSQANPYSGKSEQPDSAVGMGMQFQLGF